MSDRAVYKSTAAEFLDDLFGGAPGELEAAYERSLALLEEIGDGPLSGAAARLVDDGGLPPDAVENSERGWRAGPEVDGVIRAAYREAIRLARDRAVRIESLWVTGASEEFEVHICEGRHHITVLMFIPLVRPYGSEHARARSWVVRAAGADDADDARLPDEGDTPLVMVQMSGEGSAASAS